MHLLTHWTARSQTQKIFLPKKSCKVNRISVHMSLHMFDSKRVFDAKMLFFGNAHTKIIDGLYSRLCNFSGK